MSTAPSPCTNATPTADGAPPPPPLAETMQLLTPLWPPRPHPCRRLATAPPPPPPFLAAAPAAATAATTAATTAQTFLAQRLSVGTHYLTVAAPTMVATCAIEASVPTPCVSIASISSASRSGSGGLVHTSLTCRRTSGSTAPCAGCRAHPVRCRRDQARLLDEVERAAARAHGAT